MEIVNIIRFCCYPISLFALIISIGILFRPRLQCPRNFVHINLFIAFVLRIILLIIVDSTRGSVGSSVNGTSKKNESVKFFAEFEGTIACQSLYTLFRYSGSVYHVSISSEAVYLVLLLKFPYYSEKKGSKFSILISWSKTVTKKRTDSNFSIFVFILISSALLLDDTVGTI